MKLIWQNISQSAVSFGGDVLLALIVLFLGWMAAGWLAALLHKSLGRSKFDETLTKFFCKLVRYAVLTLAALACLSIFGIETTSFAALIASLGLAVGLALQGTLSNFAAGIMLLMFRPFHVGDVVSVAGQTGKVNAIELFTTTLDTFDNRRIIVPNGQVFGNTIENITCHPHRRTEVSVGVSYSADIDQTRNVLTEAARSVPDGLQDPEPAVVLLDLGDSAVNWSVRVWANSDDFGSVKQATTRAVKMALDQAKIEIPFPHMDVHLTKQD